MSHAQFQSVNYLQQQPVPLRQGRGAGSLGTSGLGSTVAPLAQNNSFCSHDYIRLIMMTSKTTREEYIYILWSFLSFFFLISIFCFFIDKLLYLNSFFFCSRVYFVTWTTLGWPDWGLRHSWELVGCRFVVSHPQGQNLLPKVKTSHVKVMKTPWNNIEYFSANV